jgi:hypothetical protein
MFGKLVKKLTSKYGHPHAKGNDSIQAAMREREERVLDAVRVANSEGHGYETVLPSVPWRNALDRLEKAGAVRFDRRPGARHGYWVRAVMKAKCRKPGSKKCPVCGNRVKVARGKLATHASYYYLKCPGSGRPAACRCRPARQHRDCNMCGCTSHRPDYFCGVCLVPGVDGKLIRGTGRYVCPMHRKGGR